MPPDAQPNMQPDPQSPSPIAGIVFPKGGGALQGIGEKFSASPMTGTGSLTVPIPVSPGRSGFAPELSLNYDSGSGNGIFGVGWNLSLPEIVRKTEKGLPRYRDQEDSDVFILSGQEDLVPLSEFGDRSGPNRDEVNRDGFQIRLYRPRIEGLFAKIEKWTRLYDGEVHWRAITKDNIHTIYGNTLNSRISDPAQPLHVFKWLISSSYDTRGNAIIYDYKAEDFGGIDQSRPSEQRRGRSANRHIKRVRYGNNKPLRNVGADTEDVDWMFELVFDFGDEYYEVFRTAGQEDCVRLDSAAEPITWPVRSDPFSTWRSGFEIRTYRLCRRVLLFHRFPQELGRPRTLVRTAEFGYQEKPTGSFLTEVIQSGYASHDAAYLKKSLPRLTLAYTPSPLENEVPGHFDLREADAQNLPQGIDGDLYRWIDLDGEGIAGVLTEQGAGWYYKRNRGQGRLAATRLIDRKPSSARLNSASQQLLDVGGQGQVDLVDLTHGAAGFYERSHDPAEPEGLVAGWGRFRPFQAIPVLDWTDPNLRFVDLTGDGIADILVTEDVAFRCYPSIGKEGFAPAIRIPAPDNEDDGPRIVFSDPTQSIYLADMSGDGLSDIVRIRNGEVCYWPNRGYGRFGQKILMDGSPWFDEPGLFDNRRIRLADTDGSGPTDIVYVNADSVEIYLNESGNALSPPRILRGLPNTAAGSVSVVDFLGRGTACLVWSSPLRSAEQRPLRYVDLMHGKKPHLLTRVSNNLGAETVIEYTSSTEFYLADRAAGSPWITPLPFPVHVVSRIETFDAVGRHRFVSRMSYHHGYYDAIEREFRGFGRIDQRDAEDFGETGQRHFPAGINEDAAWSVPPVLTRTWYHTGVFLGADRVSRHLANEYYHAPDDSPRFGLDDTILPRGLRPEEAREAVRALKGTRLRQEVYAEDGSEAADRPYTVSDSNATVRLLQPRGNNLHCVVYVHAREDLALSYERKLYHHDGALQSDPRVTHGVTLRVDPYGNVLQSASIAYGRRLPDDSPHLTALDREIQATPLATITDNSYTNAVDRPDEYRIPALAESRVYQLVHLPRPGTGLLRFDEIGQLTARAGDGLHDLPYEDVNAAGAVGPEPYRRLIGHSRTFYRSDDLRHLLPLHRLESMALPGETYSLTLTPGLIAGIYAGKLADPQPVLRHECGYVDLDDNGSAWAPSGRIFYSPDPGDDAEAEDAFARRHFYMPRRFRDAFGNLSFVGYDQHDLMPVETRDPVGNTTRARIDYRVLQPDRVTDANGNRSDAAFDALGRLAGTALMGKDGQDIGDSLQGFVADLPEPILLAHLRDPLHDPWAILGNATTRLVYDVFAFDRTRHQPHPEPAVTASLARETHLHDLAPGERTKIQQAFSYSDGFGREAQRKLQAEPGPVPGHGRADPRWVGSGWTIFNNKGSPVRQYEPFFSVTHRFEFAVMVGVTATLIYDPVGRVVATLNPNHTFQKTVFDPWRQEIWDTNDTVLLDAGNDLDIGPLIRGVPAGDYRPTWYDERISGALGPAEREAATKAAAHADTPGTACLDPLGRTVLSIAHNRFSRDDEPVDAFYSTRSTLDIQGNQRAVTDPLGRIIMRYDYDLGQRCVRQNSSDAGRRWTVIDVVRKPVFQFDSRDQRLHYRYDGLRRPEALFVRTGDGPDRLAERSEYGESKPDGAAHNLRGRIYRQYDGAGVLNTPSYDFKGNLLRSERQMLAGYREPVDWAGSPRREAETYSSETSYDALNRPSTLTAPDRSVIHPVYNGANLIERLEVSVKGRSEFSDIVRVIEYNAKGQREFIAYGNGAWTTTTYDPLTFRPTHLRTARHGDGIVLQDLAYSYDPVGNISSIADTAQQTIYFRNQVVQANAHYVYDAIYRLIGATGREHAGISGQPETTYNDVGRVHLPLPGDSHAMHRYREHYHYDPAGNILSLIHAAAGDGSWRRHYDYADIAGNNRLTMTRVAKTTDHYDYDANGNMTHMRHLPVMQWDFKNQLAVTRTQVVNDDGPAPTTYYTYDSRGQRARKVTEGASGKRRADRIYVGGFEIYREFNGDGETIKLERTTLHVMDDKKRIALVESRAGETTIRYQFSNHLGSCCLELDEKAAVITYEEYYPYGSTSYQAGRSIAEVSLKRYRFTGKERDHESGLYYHVARYYVPWLGRWTSCDPAGLADGPNQYAYVLNNPVGAVDPTGRWSTGWTIAVVVGVVVVVAVVTVVTLGAGTAPAAAGGAAVIGAGAEVAAGTTAVVATGAEVAAGTTAVVATGAEVAAGTTAVVATGAEVAGGATAVAAGTEVAAGTTAAVTTGTEVAAGTTTAVATGTEAVASVATGTEAAVGGTATVATGTGTGVATGGAGLTAAQVSGVSTAATAVATAASTPQGQEVIQEAEENLPVIENEAQAGLEKAEYYIQNGVRRSVATREAGLTDIPATIYRAGQAPAKTTLRLDQLFSPKPEIEANQRFLNIDPPIHTPIEVEPLGLPGQTSTVPLNQVRIIPSGN